MTAARTSERWLVTALIASSLLVRLLGIWHGLPQIYSADEELHFVPHAAHAADGHLDPHYLENPSALTYVLALAFRVVFLGHHVEGLLGTDPGLVYLVARIVVAVVGALLVYVVYRTGRAYFGSAQGLLAGGIVGFAFLPVFYSHQALNDVPTMLGVALTLLAALRVYERGGDRALLLAGCAVGLAVATKYNAAPVSLVVAAAWLLRLRTHPQEWATPARRLRQIGSVVLAGAAALAVFVLLNPFFLIHLGSGLHQVFHEGDQAAGSKLGQSGSSPSYYANSLLWGFGLIPVLAAVVGTVAGLRTRRAHTMLLLLFPVLLFCYVSTQGRFFGRWMLPAYPALAILAGHGVTVTASWLRAHAPVALRTVIWPALALLLLAQPVADSVRSDVLLTRTDTRTEALRWLRAHTRPGDRIVLEPALPAHYLDGLGLEQFPTARPYQEYESRLGPDLIDTYRAEGYCWVYVDSQQRDRGLAAGLPGARAYYDQLHQDAQMTAVFSPYRQHATPPRFSYDFSFDYYPLAFARPGPDIEVIRLSNCRDARR